MNTRAVSPTLWDANLWCARTTMIFPHKLHLRHKYKSWYLPFWHRHSTWCRLCWLWNGIGNYAVMVMTICTQDSLVHLNVDHMWAKAAALPRIGEPCLIFLHMYSISARQSPWKSGLANKRCWICQDVNQDICQQFSRAPQLRSNCSKSSSVARNQQASV